MRTVIVSVVLAYAVPALVWLVVRQLRAGGWELWDVKGWPARVRIRIQHQYSRDEDGDWSWSVLHLCAGRNLGVGAVEVTMLGLILRVVVLLDKDAQAKYQERRRAMVAEVERQMKESLARALRQAAPPGTTVSVGDEAGMVTVGDDDDGDDDGGSGRPH